MLAQRLPVTAAYHNLPVQFPPSVSKVDRSNSGEVVAARATLMSLFLQAELLLERKHYNFKTVNMFIDDSIKCLTALGINASIQEFLEETGLKRMFPNLSGYIGVGNISSSTSSSTSTRASDSSTTMNNVFYYLRWFTKLNKVMTLAKQLHDDCLSGLQSHQPYFEQQIGLLYKALTSIRKPSQETVSLYDEISNKLYDMQHPRLPWDAADTKWLKEITAEVMELVGNSMELLPPSSDVSQHRSHKHTPQKTTISSDQTSITNVVEWMLSE